MKKLFLVLIPALMFLATDCENEPDFTIVTLDFKANYDGAPLVMFNEAYDYPGDNQIKFQLFQFYISEVELLASPNDTEGTKLSAVELVQFKNQFNADEALVGQQFEYPFDGLGEVSAIRFVLGLTPELNATSPGDYAANAPLSDNYWSAARGYVYTKIEGNADTNSDGQFSTGLTYHVGSNDLQTTLTFPVTHPLLLGERTIFNFDIDLKKVMAPGNSFIDIDQEENTIDHGNDPNIYEPLYNNLAEALEANF